MLRVIIVVLCSLLWFNSSAEQAYVEGQHYERITPELATQRDGKIEVIEVFWYWCHHCFSFESELSEWLISKPDNVVFRRVPGIFARTWVPHARAYFTAEILGVLDKIHSPLFEAIHEQHRKIGDEDSLARFFAEHGVSDEAFREAYNSFSVDTKTRQAMTASKDYGITGVPSMIVNGRFRSSARLTGTYENLLKVVDHLVDIETTQ